MSESLQDLIDAAKAEAAALAATAAAEPAKEVPVAEAPVAAAVPEATAPETVEPSTGGDTKPNSQDEPASWLRQFVSNAGFAVDGLPESEIEEFVAKKIKPATAEVRDVQVAPPTQQEAVVSERSTASAEPTKAEPAKADPPARKLQPLKFESELAEYVTFDEKGVAVPKPELGAEGIDAARKLNSYANDRRKRIEALADDPVGLVKDDLLDEVERRVNERFAKYDAEIKARQEAERQQYVVQSKAQQEQENLQRLLTENRAKLYDLAPNGEPKLALDGSVKMSAYGRDVDGLYLELKQTSRPDVADAVLIAQAMKLADRLHVPVKDPVAEAQAKAAEVAAKKAAYLDDGKKHVPPVTIDKPPATLEEMMASGAKMSLMEMIKADAANQGNPVLSKLG
jgi:hypothetical protein